MKSDRFLIKAAELYYRDGLSQQEIAKKLHTSRTSISRALIQARNEGYVQIRIQYPEQSDLALERKLEEKYGLTEALIAVPAYEQSSDQEVAIQSDSWNTTTYSNTLATKVGNLLHCASYNLSAPMYVEGTKEKELIESIDEIAKVLHMAETADIALIGIGSMQDDSSIIKAEIRTKEEYKELVRKGAVGEIVGRIYDKNGQTVDEDLKRKMVGISLDKIAKIPVRVGMSYGKDKIEAIKGAIAGGLVNVLVTDVPTAELLLK